MEQSSSLPLIQYITPSLIAVSYQHNLSFYSITNNTTFKPLTKYDHTDEILDFLFLTNNPNETSNRFIILGKANKSIDLLTYTNPECTITHIGTYINSKKLTCAFITQESKDHFLFIADKFGEITIKLITPNDNSDSFKQKGKIVSGHCDSITSLKLSKDKQLLLSSDTFGKIKIYQFPNMFNVLSVLLYMNESVKYVDFIGNSSNAVIVYTKNNEIDIWSMFDFIKQTSVIVDYNDNEEFISITQCHSKSEFIIETTTRYIIYEANALTYTITKVNEILKSTFIKDNEHDDDNTNATKYKLVYDLNGNKCLFNFTSTEGTLTNIKQI